MTSSNSQRFPVIALGGSAGGLEAFFAFFEALGHAENAADMAFIVVLHIAPDEESHLADLLTRRSPLPVRAVDARMPVEAGQVYVLPPGRTLNIEEGALVPSERAAGAAHRPVDDIFNGIARAFGECATAIVCSGTGSNGSSALGAIREAAGCTFAQSPETAEFDAMPRNAIATGLVDLVATIEDMLPALGRNAERLGRTPVPVTREREAEAATRPPEGPKKGKGGATYPEYDLMDRILDLLRARNGIDFRRYKSGTLHRRIDRRASLQDAGAWSSYAELLESSPQELDTLTGDLLINVTGFFRDGTVWDTLRDTALAPMIRDRPGGEPLRIWSAGCASGEEAYSAAIMTSDLIAGRRADVPVEIFASDVSTDALSRGRAGRYPLGAVAGLPERTINRWFQSWDETVEIKSELREQIVFAHHNLIQDPPFSRIDLVICRNLLIYLRPEVQQQLIRLFHFALRDGGCLFLGSAESIGPDTDLFEPVDKAAHIWRRVGPTRHGLVDFPLDRAHPRDAFPNPAASPAPRGPTPAETGAAGRVAEEARAALAEWHAPPSVVVDRDLNVLYFHGAVDRFLKPRSGEATQNLMALARDDLVPHLRRASETAKTSDHPGEAHCRAELDGAQSMLRLVAAPMPGNDGRLLISFHAETTAWPRQDDGEVPEGAATRERELEDEVSLLREELTSTAWSASRNEEDARAYNEEMTSMNEELRVANEELETSKEELQSLNEELRTVNHEQRSTLDELRERTADLDNLMSSTGVATLFLDSDLSVRWFSPGLQELFHIREADIGRPLSHVVRAFRDDALEDECRTVLRRLDPRERLVQSDEARNFQRRITPYRDGTDRIDGVVVTYSDVTEIHEARRYAERIVETVPMPLLVLDTNHRVLSANPTFYAAFRVDPAATEGRLIYHLGNGQWNIPELRRLLDEVLPDNGAFETYEVTHDFEDIGRRTMVLSGSRMDDAQSILLAIEDISGRKEAETHQELLMGELGHRVKNALGVVQGLASQTIRRSASLAEFQEKFSGRLAAYSRAHSQLLAQDWRPGTLTEIISGAIESHAVDPEQVAMAGPDLRLSSQQALSLGLILHELETNAIKYGAFSAEAGRVSVKWTFTEDGDLRLTWSESGGPEVSQPESEGFGSILIRQFTEYDLGGVAAITYAATGLTCVLVFPLEADRDD